MKELAKIRVSRPYNFEDHVHCAHLLSGELRIADEYQPLLVDLGAVANSRMLAEPVVHAYSDPRITQFMCDPVLVGVSLLHQYGYRNRTNAELFLAGPRRLRKFYGLSALSELRSAADLRDFLALARRGLADDAHDAAVDLLASGASPLYRLIVGGDFDIYFEKLDDQEYDILLSSIARLDGVSGRQRLRAIDRFGSPESPLRLEVYIDALTAIGSDSALERALVVSIVKRLLVRLAPNDYLYSHASDRIQELLAL